MTIGLTHKAVAHLAAAIGVSDTQLVVGPSEYEPILSADGDSIYLLIRGPVNRELVKVSLQASEWGSYLTVERGQGGTTAVTWPLGSMLFATTHEDHYNSIIQAGENRTIDYNPNEVLAPLYAGEKVYQSTVGYKRWWKSFNGTDLYWDIITGAAGAGEDWTDIGWDYPILKSSLAWDATNFDNTKWEIEFANYGEWVPSYWNSIVNASYHRIYLSELGIWNVGYEPSKVRVTVTGAPASLRFNMKFGTFTRTLTTAYTSLTEMDIDPSWYNDGPLNVLQFYAWNTWPFTITAIEFYV